MRRLLIAIVAACSLPALASAGTLRPSAEWVADARRSAEGMRRSPGPFLLMREPLIGFNELGLAGDRVFHKPAEFWEAIQKSPGARIRKTDREQIDSFNWSDCMLVVFSGSHPSPRFWDSFGTLPNPSVLWENGEITVLVQENVPCPDDIVAWYAREMSVPTAAVALLAYGAPVRIRRVEAPRAAFMARKLDGVLSPLEGVSVLESGACWQMRLFPTESVRWAKRDEEKPSVVERSPHDQYLVQANQEGLPDVPYAAFRRNAVPHETIEPLEKAALTSGFLDLADTYGKKPDGETPHGRMLRVTVDGTVKEVTVWEDGKTAAPSSFEAVWQAFLSLEKHLNPAAVG